MVMGYECKHAVYTRAQDGSDDDLVVVKEWVHQTDGTQTPQLRFYENYERPFWVTHEQNQNHTSKKEWESVKKLKRFKTRQSRLIQSIGRALGRPNIKGSLKNIARNPYLYGTDITTPTLIKELNYRRKHPKCMSPNRVAVFDIETDVLNGTELPIMMSLTFKDRAYIAIVKDFVGGLMYVEDRVKSAFTKYLGEYEEKRNIKLEVQLVDTAGQAIIETFKRAHEWKPDFVSIWNIDFDIPRCVMALEKEGIDPAMVFSDPKVPDRYKFFRYKKGNTQKKTASGAIVPIHSAEQWHVAECPASFFLIDSMCVYKRIRLAKQNKPSYSLDAILGSELSLAKLRFKEADQYKGLAWHEFMQAQYKIEYAVYCLFDCIAVELLDEKTKDLCQVISTQSKASEYTIYNSQPKRLVDDLFFFCMDRGKVPAACSDEMVDELDEFVVGMNDWIVTLPSHLTAPNGLCVLEELPTVRSHIRTHVADY